MPTYKVTMEANIQVPYAQPGEQSIKPIEIRDSLMAANIQVGARGLFRFDTAFHITAIDFKDICLCCGQRRPEGIPRDDKPDGDHD